MQKFADLEKNVGQRYVQSDIKSSQFLRCPTSCAEPSLSLLPQVLPILRELHFRGIMLPVLKELLLDFHPAQPYIDAVSLPFHAPGFVNAHLAQVFRFDRGDENAKRVLRSPWRGRSHPQETLFRAFPGSSCQLRWQRLRFLRGLLHPAPAVPRRSQTAIDRRSRTGGGGAV